MYKTDASPDLRICSYQVLHRCRAGDPTRQETVGEVTDPTTNNTAIAELTN